MTTPFPPGQPAGGSNPDPAQPVYPAPWPQQPPAPIGATPVLPGQQPPPYSPPAYPPAAYPPQQYSQPLRPGYPPAPPSGWPIARPGAGRGMLVAAVGGLAVVAGWFLLPFLNVGFLGSYAAVQLVGAYSSPSSTSSSSSLGQNIVTFLLALAGAGVVIALVAGIESLSSWQTRSAPTPAALLAARLIVILAAGVGLVCLLAAIMSFGENGNGSSSASSFLTYAGGGFWLIGIGLLVALVGGIVA